MFGRSDATLGLLDGGGSVTFSDGAPNGVSEMRACFSDVGGARDDGGDDLVDNFTGTVDGRLSGDLDVNVGRSTRAEVGGDVCERQRLATRLSAKSSELAKQ